jgi:hypothetical protein
MLKAIPTPIPPLIPERRLTLDEQKLEIEDKRAEKNTLILEKRLELEIKQLDEDSKRRKRRWDMEDEDRKRRRFEDATRAATQGRANIEFLLQLAKTPGEGGSGNEAFRKHVESVAMKPVDALAQQTIDSLSGHSGGIPNADVAMEENMLED